MSYMYLGDDKKPMCTSCPEKYADIHAAICDSKTHTHTLPAH